MLVHHGFDIKLIGASMGGGVLVQGKGPNLPSPFLDPWWNRAAQGAGLLKNRSKVKRYLSPDRLRIIKIKVKAKVQKNFHEAFALKERLYVFA